MLTYEKVHTIVKGMPKYLMPVGSYLRKKKNPNDIDIISLRPLEQAKKYLKKKFKIVKTNEDGDRQYFIDIKRYNDIIPINVWYFTRKELPYAYFWLSYPKDFVIRVRGHLKQKGYKLSQFGLKKGEKNIRMKNNEDFFKLLQKIGYNYPYRTPEEQEIKSARGIDMEGEGFLDDAWNAVKTGVQKVGEFVKNVPTVIKNIPELFKGLREDAPPYVRDFLKTFGELRIQSAKVCKNPIEKVFDGMINAISLGEFEKKKRELNYDDMFHLFMILTTVEGREIIVEKNQVVNIAFTKPIPAMACMPVNLDANNIYSLNDMLNKTVQKIGKNKMWVYDPKSQNCQWFLRNILDANGLLTPALEDFIMQDTNKVVGELPSITQKVMRGLTDVAGMWDVLLYGRAIASSGRIKKVVSGKGSNAKYMGYRTIYK